jgi:precorrin-2 methylase
MLGTFYGIGVGPGDPELITVKATRVLGSVQHVFAAASSNNDYSVACDIARQYLVPGTPVDYLAFPMTFNRDTSRTWPSAAKGGGSPEPKRRLPRQVTFHLQHLHLSIRRF